MAKLRNSRNVGDKTIPNYETVKEIIVKGTEKGGDKRQIVFLDKNKRECKRTYNQTWREISALGTFFWLNGLDGQKKIAIIGENCYEWILSFYTILTGGNISVPMDCKLPADDLADQLIRCHCDALIYTPKFQEMVNGFKSIENMPQMKYFCTEDFPEYISKGIGLLDKGNRAFLDAEVKPERLACIAYTSGTTGKSKGVMLTQKNIAVSCSSSCRVLSGKHVIGFLPLNHTYAWVIMLSGYIVTEWGYLCDSLKDIQGDMKKYKPYNFSAVPLVVETIYDRIWKTAKKTGKEDILKKGIKLSNFLMKLGIDKRRKIFKPVLDNLGGNLSMIICGGAFLDPKYEKGLHDIGIDVFNGYGITECSPAITCNRPDKFKFGSVGSPLDCCEVKIVDPDENGVGEIYVKGDNVMQGYYGEPEATAEAFDGEWFKTGDFGRIDKDGFLFIVGRKKNLIILSNGKNVSPEELEDKLLQIDYVKEVLVYEENSQIVAEFFLNEEDYPDARDKLPKDINDFNRKMPLFKNICKYKVRDEEFPKTTTLKIVRKYKDK